MPDKRKRTGAAWRMLHNSPGAQIAIYFTAFAMLIGLNTYIFHALYPLFEAKPLSWSEALLFVVESMATVGYGWLLPFSNDLTRILAIQIMLSGVVMIFIVVPLLLAPFLTSLLAPTPPRRTPHKLEGHMVVIGYDELTRSLIESLTISDHEIVIVEKDKALALEIGSRFRRRAYVIWGDYTDPSTLSAAHIANAAFTVISKDERLTANVVLAIRDTTNGKILAVVDKLSFERYLRYAGADYVLSPKNATGRILAHHTVINHGGDTVSDIPGLDRLSIDLIDRGEKDLRLINIPVATGCRAAGKSLAELNLFDRFGVAAQFLWKSGTFIANPDRSEILDGNTSVFLFGRADAIVAAIRSDFDTDGTTPSLAVIAGFGDVGASAYAELVHAGVTCVIVDSKKHNLPHEVVGNAEDEQVLRQAGIDEAQFCVVALNNDDVNIFTTLMARNLNPGIRILARANEPASVDKLYRAGADYVTLLPTIGAQIIGRIVLADLVTIILDLPDGNMVVMKHASSTGRTTTVEKVQNASGVRILGIEGRARTVVTPVPGEVIIPGDAVIAAGDAAQLKRFLHEIS